MRSGATPYWAKHDADGCRSEFHDLQGQINLAFENFAVAMYAVALDLDNQHLCKLLDSYRRERRY